jgi:Tfp pilus assembly PilM family ATPase
MVRSYGIDPGEGVARVVELDGNYRRARLVRVQTGEAPLGGDLQVRADAVAAVVQAAVAAGCKGEPVLGHPCREAVLRGLELPFSGTEQIRKVVKAEVEGEIQGYVVDDMVVDFLELGPGSEGGTRLLVAAVPKAPIKAQLEALAGHGSEPEEVDLDTLALWRTAHWCGAFAEAGDAAPGAVTAVLELGARSVKVVLVEGERIVDMRVIRLGDGAAADAIAARLGLPAPRAYAAMHECLRTGQDVELEVEDLPPAPLGEAGDTPAPVAVVRRVVVEAAFVAGEQQAFVQRLARELVRYLTSVPKANAVRALWVTGSGLRVPGLGEMLGEVFGIEPRELDLFANLQHDLTAEELEQHRGSIAVALGLALGKLGGPAGFNLRQEDLVVQRGFERVKFPLAIACMVGLLALLVYGFSLSAQLRNLEYEIGRTHVDPTKPGAPPTFHGMLFQVLGGKWFEDGSKFRLEQDKGKDYTYKNLVEELVALPVHERLNHVRNKLRLVADQKQKESGIFEEVSLESGLAVLVRWAQVMKSIEPQLGRYLLFKVGLNMKVTGTGAGSRRLEFTVAFRGNDFRDRHNAMMLALEAEYERADSPFTKPPARAEAYKEELFRDEAESGVPGAYYKYTLTIKDSFQPFGASQPTVPSR